MHEDNRQNPSNLPALIDTPDDHEYDADMVQDTVLEVKELLGVRTALENYRDQIQAAGVDGLDPVAKAIMQVNLTHLQVSRPSVGLEAFNPGMLPSMEDIGEQLSNLGKKIMVLINKLIETAKRFAAKIMSGIETVKTQAEELIDRIRNKRSGQEKSFEFHKEEREVTISSPGILFADGVFCLDDFQAEQDVIKFFTGHWPKYVADQINRAKKMIAEYDVESGNSENFNANAEFIGNHESMARGILDVVLPGNQSIAFKYVALGPELVDAKGVKAAPDTHSFPVRPDVEITGTLRKNVVTMNALGNLFKEEGNILQQMSTLSRALGELENRRGETVWKSAREGLDTISNMMMDLITKLNPHYDPIIRHLAKIGTARNATCRKEMDTVS